MDIQPKAEARETWYRELFNSGQPVKKRGVYIYISFMHDDDGKLNRRQRNKRKTLGTLPVERVCAGR